jgi:hypothetical protein
MENLWPNVDTAPTVTTPLSILREQGAVLGQITKNILEGEVISETDEAPESSDSLDNTLRILTMSPVELRAARQQDPVFYHSFYIKAPVLGNYRYKLLYVQHPITLYPASIVVNGRRVECADEREFKAHLSAALSAKKTTDVLAALINQSRN